MMGNIMWKIINAIEQGELFIDQEITRNELIRIGINKSTASTFISKHSKPSSPSKFKQYFIKIRRGVYKLNLKNRELISSLKNHYLFYYRRGLLWDHVSDTTGLNRLNLMNSHYLIGKNVIKYVADNQHLLFNIQSKKNIALINKFNKEYFKEAEGIRKKLGILKPAEYGFDTYYGTLINYALGKVESEKGTGYSPIYHKINKLKGLLPDKTNQLNSIYRRLNYIELLSKEFTYILERYDIERIPILLEWITNKFETFTSVSTELVMSLLEFYYDVHPRLKPIANRDLRFIKLFNLVKDEISFFNSYTGALYIFIAVKLRNDIVHHCGYNLNKKNNKLFISFQKEIYYKSNNNIHSIFKNLIKKNIVTNISKKVSKDKWYTINDCFYDYVSWNVRMQKNGKWDTNNFKIIIRIELIEFVNLMINGILYQLGMNLFGNLKNVLTK